MAAATLTMCAATLTLTGCGIATRIGFGPTVDTNGTVGAEGHIAFGYGTTLERGVITLNSIGHGGFSGAETTASAGGGLELSAGSVADSGLALRFGALFSARHTFPSGEDAGPSYGLGGNVALLASLSEDTTEQSFATPFGDVPTSDSRHWWLLGLQAQFDYVWGSGSYGVGSFPVVLEFWNATEPPHWL